MLRRGLPPRPLFCKTPCRNFVVNTDSTIAGSRNSYRVKGNRLQGFRAKGEHTDDMLIERSMLR